MSSLCQRNVMWLCSIGDRSANFSLISLSRHYAMSVSADWRISEWDQGNPARGLTEASALSTSARQHPPTPSCRGHRPCCGENSELGRNITESLTSNPRVREQPQRQPDFGFQDLLYECGPSVVRPTNQLIAFELTPVSSSAAAKSGSFRSVEMSKNASQTQTAISSGPWPRPMPGPIN